MLTQATTYYDSMAVILTLVSLFFLALLLLVVLFAMRPIKTQDIAPLPSLHPPPHQTVQADYLRAMAWLSKNHFLSQSTRLIEAPNYLYGVFLADYYASLKLPNPLFIGVLRCIHTLSIQPIENDPLRCLVIDTQITRRMVTYHAKTYRRVATQDLGNRAVVYEMCYDTPSDRWKLNRFIQELPNGWNGVQSAYPVAWSTQFPTHTVGHQT
ncbi:MAG: hypothetical protein MUE54_12490 [Anaerolineae bacterium]|jgi:hypothetical protein|nr:hypothetical protein [Anaerolineae bacterium]